MLLSAYLGQGIWSIERCWKKFFCVCVLLKTVVNGHFNEKKIQFTEHAEINNIIWKASLNMWRGGVFFFVVVFLTILYFDLTIINK